MWPFTSSGTSANGSSDAGPSSSLAQPQQVAPAAAASPSSSSSSQQDSPTTYLSSGSGQFDRSNPVFDPSQAPSTQDFFSNPTFDIARLHPLAGLGKDEVEYLDIVDAQPSTLEGARTALPSRGWSDDLCYGTGTTYLSGLAFGGLRGAQEGLRRPLGIQSPTLRLRLNAVLNQVTRSGSFFGNTAGVVALIYNIADASIDAARGKHDMVGSIAAGGVSGALFKCTAGLRPMAISSGIMMALAATWTTAKRELL